MKKTIQYKDGNLLSYTDYGDKSGYPTLIQHGLIASIEDYDLFALLAELGARLISIARPGYGQSSVYLMKNIGEWGEIVAALVDELQFPSFDVFGISSGAPYSYAIGCQLPDKVRNIYILSGIPALYDEEVISFWPYPVIRNASIAQMEKLAHQLFFSNVSSQDLKKANVRDSMMNNCFGIAQDLKLRCMDWGFRLSDVKANVMMRHSWADDSYITAEITSRLLPNCMFETRDDGEHFSKEMLDNFIQTTMAKWYV